MSVEEWAARARRAQEAVNALGAGPPGEVRRDDGMNAVERHRADDEWRQRADHWIVTLALEDEPFTAEDVCRLAGRPRHPNAVGARFNAWANRKLITAVAFAKASRDSRHASRMLVWQGTGEAQVTKVPELPPPSEAAQMSLFEVRVDDEG